MRRGRGFAVLGAAAVIAVSGALSACQPSGSGDSAAASRIAGQIASSASFPLYIRGEYKTYSANEAWIEILPKAAAAMNLPARAGCDDMRTWLRSHGGVDSGWSDIAILLRARRKVKLVITAAESVILKRYPAASAPSTLTCVPGKSSWVEQEESLNWPNYTPGFVLDINDDLGTPWQPANYSSSGNALTMEPGAEQYELLTGFTSRCDCAWGVELYLTVNGAPKKVLVENGKEPFRTAPGPAYPDDSARNAVWCAGSGQPRLDPPKAADCPPPATYEEVPVF
jgi:hypothetical protein